MRLARVDASSRLLLFPFVVVAVVAHIFGIMFLVGMSANEQLLEFRGVESHWVHAFQQLILLAEGLPLEVADGVIRELFLVGDYEGDGHRHTWLDADVFRSLIILGRDLGLSSRWHLRAHHA